MENGYRRRRGYRMGPRVEVTTRVPPEIHAACRELAEQRGISLTSLVAGLMATEVGKAGLGENQHTPTATQVA
jgi:hypothetical protein